MLSMQMAFMLPADFNGSFEDAVLTWLAYRKARGYPIREANKFETEVSENTILNEAQLILSEKLFEGLKDGKRSVVSYVLAEYDKNAGKWKPLPV